MSVIIEYPATSPTSTLTLKSPAMGDSFTNKPQVKMHVTMGKSFITTRRTPTRAKLLLTFKNSPIECYDELELLDSFLSTVKGREVRLSFGGDVWVGKILASPLEIKYTRKDRAEFVLELHGIKTSGNRIYLEDGSGFLLLEDGSYFLLEENTP